MSRLHEASMRQRFCWWFLRGISMRIFHGGMVTAPRFSMLPRAEMQQKWRGARAPGPATVRRVKSSPRRDSTVEARS